MSGKPGLSDRHRNSAAMGDITFEPESEKREPRGGFVISPQTCRPEISSGFHGLVAIGGAICAAGIYIGDTDDAPGAALMGILLMIGAVALSVKIARRKTCRVSPIAEVSIQFPMCHSAPDVVLIGGGIMSAHLGVMLKRLDPRLTIEVYEAATEPARE
eukprot:gene50035-61239_t